MTRLSAALAALVLLLTSFAAQAQYLPLTIESSGAVHSFAIEVMDTPQERAQGMMFRESLGPDAGMLFIFEETRPVSFWMRNTLIPLDMVFIRENGIIANVHANAIPHDETSVPSDGPVRFVLEIPGGRAAELGIKAGDRVVHPLLGNAG